MQTTYISMGLIIYINNRFKFLIYRCERERENRIYEFVDSYFLSIIKKHKRYNVKYPKKPDFNNLRYLLHTLYNIKQKLGSIYLILFF